MLSYQPLDSLSTMRGGTLHPQLSINPNPRIPFQTIYEDEHLIALNKPSGIVTQPGVKHTRDTLLNGAFAHWGKQLQNLGKKRDFGLLHRLDRGTSGVVLLAKTLEAYDGMRHLFETRQIQKIYLTIVSGFLKPPRGQCSIPIAEQRVSGRKKAILVPQNFATSKKVKNNKGRPRQAMKYTPSLKGQKAVTKYLTLESCKSKHGYVSLVKCDLLTGRLHQIRVHMKALHTPVLGDFDYAGKTALNLLVKQQGKDFLALHAGEVCFQHPISGDRVEVQAPPPEWFFNLLEELNITAKV